MDSASNIRHVKARKEHACFLCPLPIEAGTVYRRWAWFHDGSARTMRVHPACYDYAGEHLAEWSGDGVEECAVFTHLDEQITECRPADRAERIAEIRAQWPALSALVDRVVAEQEEVNDAR
jgi:hypothetical protein